ncbi:RlpA-like protein, double-psi beta-barrel domain [Cinara cedri]|uniref:RlpA-like protein, double-psi beta-barrel domain n=1 Tax=Cinara cedri TaxID=506608 RepID=A0A5E4NDT1_9HEMI|nr:RlpA-like protein, double-psi beta-barrel domain [Cinara cedri]
MNDFVLLSSVALLMLQLGSSCGVNVPPGLPYYGDMTFWQLGGETACGTYQSNDDSVCAINPSHWTSPNPHFDPVCGKLIKIWDPSTSRSIEVTVKDKCGSCSDSDIDVSPTSFTKLQPSSVGRHKVYWGFIH